MQFLLKVIPQLLDEGRFEKARSLLYEVFDHAEDQDAETRVLVQIRLYGLLIDLGNESKNEQDLLKAIDFCEKNQDEIKKHITSASYYYNLANARDGLCEIYYRASPAGQSLSLVKEKLQEPIQLYWLSYKNTKPEDGLLKQILVNLANALVRVGRLVEAIQFLDTVLKQDPNFPQALVSRASQLDWLSQVSNGGYTAALYVQIYVNYEMAIGSKKLPRPVLERIDVLKENSRWRLVQLNFDISGIAQEIIQTEKEYLAQNKFRKFCIDNFLTLNEHGIYCGCVANEKDNLQIGVPNASFKGNIVPKLELLLNRLKSEFSYARWSYYQSKVKTDKINFDAQYTNLLEGEIINPFSEMLRISFRICYGILDKIALGICKLYGLDAKRIHFETFWDDKKRKEKIEIIQNFHLNALYSIACDLNTTDGELRHFKNWRNKLEHNLLILRSEEDISYDIFDIIKDEEFVVLVDIKDFEAKTIHLLQLTRAAIFSFAYCVRLQIIEPIDERSEPVGPIFVMDFK
ncbi:LA2681 family HEPN domain-containing protein [Dyadobacter sp. 32]|uniref:LA2681 family HEPN domain-containing protein n=1 Tax=Dyadobacter sp. 32 TaxID=538966 RepID=UPI0011F06A7D